MLVIICVNNLRFKLLRKNLKYARNHFVNVEGGCDFSDTTPVQFPLTDLEVGNKMSNNENISSWLSSNLSDVLSFPVPPDLTEYILTIENDRDLDDYLKTLLDFKNPSHRAFVEKYKIIRHGGEKKNKNEQPKVNTKKKNKSSEKVLETPKPEPKINDENEEPENKAGAKPKKRNKFVSLYSPDAASRDVIFLKGRHLCECQATKHRLINNCLKCGRIVCAQEGSGPCLYCGTLVCSAEEQNILNTNTKQAKKLYDTLMDSRKGDDLEKAVAQRNRLLEYDRTTQQRSKVIDDESDYFSTNSSWLSKEERDRLQKKEAEMHAKRHSSRLERKVTLDFAGRQVIEEIGDEELDEEFYKDTFNKIEETLAESHAHPDFPVTVQPIFISDKEPEDYPALDSINPPSKNLNYKVQDKELLLISDNGACLSMHQPWASLLVRGIKKHEGRTWYTSHRGRLWIAAASKAPTEENIKEIEGFYKMRESDDIKFPTSYPTSCLLGCVSLTDCLPQEEYRVKYPDGESESPFVFICEEPQELDIRFPMSGSHKIYKLDTRIQQAAKKALLRVAKQKKSEA